MIVEVYWVNWIGVYVLNCLNVKLVKLLGVYYFLLLFVLNFFIYLIECEILGDLFGKLILVVVLRLNFLKEFFNCW